MPFPIACVLSSASERGCPTARDAISAPCTRRYSSIRRGASSTGSRAAAVRGDWLTSPDARMTVDSTLATLGWDEDDDKAFQAPEPGVEPARALEVKRGFVRVRAAGGEWLAPIPPALRRGSDAFPQPGPPATGDWLAVEAEGPVRGILERRSILRRYDETAGDELLVANADQAFVVSSLNQDLNLNRLERLLAIAHEGGVPVVLALSKCDLAEEPAAATRSLGQTLGVEAVAFSSRTGAGLDELRRRLRPRETSVLLGSSGVGKSTLVNTLLGEERQRTLEIRGADEKGRHATTTRTLVELPGGALLVDTPGLRSPRPSGLDGLPATFPDIFALAAECRFADCTHDSEPGCAVRAAVEDGELDLRRLDSLRKLEREVEEAEARRAAASTGRRGRSVRERAASRAYQRGDDES